MPSGYVSPTGSIPVYILVQYLTFCVDKSHLSGPDSTCREEHYSLLIADDVFY